MSENANEELNLYLLVCDLGVPVFREHDTKTGTPQFPTRAFHFVLHSH